MNNKSLQLVLSTAMCLAFALLPGARAESWVDGSGRTWTYTLSGGKATLTGVNPVPETLSVPLNLDGHELVAIGEEAFKGKTGLKKLTVVGPGTIGFQAFSGCTGLTNVSLSTNVKTIGAGAFEGCTALQTAKINTGTESIASSAFAGCTKLAEVAIPDSVWGIAPGAFARCSKLTALNVAAGSPYYETHDGVLFTKDGSTLVCCPAGKTGAFASCPAGTACVMGSAFAGCTGLTQATFPDSVEEIGYQAFAGCTGLAKLDGCTGLVQIGGEAFSGCTQLTQVAGCGNLAEIGWAAFAGCTKLETISLAGVTNFGDRAFRNCAALKTLSFGPGLSAIGTAVFSGCAALTSVSVPGTVKTIGEGAFTECSGLKTLAIGNGVKTIGRVAFRLCTSLEKVSVPDSVTSLGDGAFSACSALQEATIGKGIASLGRETFYQCSQLKKTAVPGNVKSIGDLAFAQCGALESLPLGNGVETIGCEAFFLCAGLKTLTFPASVAVVGTNALAVCNALETLYVPAAWEGTAMLADAGVPDTCTVVPCKYSIAFNANGGTGTMPVRTVPRDTAVKLPANQFKRTGWVFTGWSKSKTGAVAYANGAKVKNLAATGGSATLYAVWAKARYTVKFNANGGTLPAGKTMAAQKMTYGKAANLRKNAFTRKDCAFRGWATSKSGKVAYKNGQSVKNLRTDGKTTVLYAKWAKKNYTVAFNANGGKGSMAKQTMTWGKEAKLRKNAFTRKGCTFKGWAKAKGGAVAYKNAQAVKNLRTDGKTTVLYAVWKKNDANPKSAAVEAGTAAAAEEPWAVVTTSDGSDGSAVADGDGGTAWSPASADGSWVVLSFADVLDVADVEVEGENLPDGTRILISEDADDWQEGVPGKARYVWVAFPAGGQKPVVREIRVEEK